jgi:DNA-binding NtrC family response regulator
MRNESVIILSPHEHVRASLGRLLSEAGYSTQQTAQTSGIVIAGSERPDEGEIRFESGVLPTLEDVERLYIEHVVNETGHNISRAARILAIDRTTLYNKLRRYGLARRSLEVAASQAS